MTYCRVHSQAVEAALGRGRQRSGRRSRARRILPVAIGTARGAKRRPPPAVTARAAAAAAAATARIPAPARVTTLLLLQHLEPDGENLIQVCSKPFSPCTKLGVWKRTETGIRSRVSTFEPERRLLSVVLFWDAAWRLTASFGTDFVSWLALGENQGKKVALRVSGSRDLGKSWPNSVLATAGP